MHSLLRHAVEATFQRRPTVGTPLGPLGQYSRSAGVSGNRGGVEIFQANKYDVT